MKVAHITTIDMSLRHLLLRQLDALRDRGFEVFGISAEGPYANDLRARGITHLHVPMKRKFDPFGDLRAFWSMYRTIRKYKFTIVHTHTPKAALIGQYAALFAGTPVRMHTIHGLYFPAHMTARTRWMYVLAERLTMMFSHLNLSQNPEDIPVAISEKISDPERIRYLGNGIDLSFFNPEIFTVQEKQRLRERLNLLPHHIVVGTVARFVVEKGYLDLLQAAQMVKEKNRNVRFLIIGSPEANKSGSLDPAMISKIGLDDSVFYLGYRADVRDLYGIMDMFVLPSLREGFPRSAMEASTMGLPIVATDIRGCRQVVGHEETGYLVPVRDANALARSILRIAEDEQLRTSMGKNARRKALAEFDEQKVVERLLDAYDDALAGTLGNARPEGVFDVPSTDSKTASHRRTNASSPK